ncbi:ATP-grasp domain-containing protein, partial [Aspergillus alliaceus]|uniref:ATP-grasp domain-containing protein n=1 Tax=Petromyces alliaceus TaxID=209559 RepID=UPI0012A57680
MAASHKIQIWSQHVLLGEHTWRVLRTSYRENYQWQSVDCVLTNVNSVCAVGGASLSRNFNDLRVVVVHQEKQTLLEAKSFGAAEAYKFFLQTLLTPVAQGQERLIKLIVPLAKGYIVRSDIIPIRLHDCLLVEQIISFAKPLQRYESETTPILFLDKDDISLPAIFTAAAACILVRPVPQADLEDVSSELDEELNNRLSFPWIIPEIARQRTLVLVEANSSHPGDGLGLYTAAAALGISLVVLDNAGHWIGSPDNAHICEAFIPTRLTIPPERDMTDHILASLRAYGKPVDGIVTFADNFWPHVAEAAKVVGLPTASPESFRTATNKYLTSIFAGHQAYHASSLAQAISVAQEHDLPYPLIVKPCGGWSSEGVHRVDSRSALEDAVSAIIASRHGPEFVIEPYCDGPEVDVNLVLQDGELLFFEVCDDLPKSADVNGPSFGSLTNFHELGSVYPSNLPEAEIQLLRETFLAMLLSLGLRSGVMHLEGRIENSAVEYTT